jgi:hypothetical protein
MKHSLVFFLIFIVSLAYSVHAIGISPPSITIDFQPDLVDEQSFTVLNNLGQDMTAQVSVSGVLAAYIKPNYTEIDVPTGKVGTFKFTAKLPDVLPPGLNSAKVLITGIGKTTGPGMFNVRTAVEGLYIVRVPFPGKFIDFYWTFDDIKVNETVLFTVNVVSRGNETINEVSGYIDIFDLNWQDIRRIPTTTIKNLEATKSDNIYANWDSTGFPPGLYNVKLTIYYDGIYKEEVRKLHVGTLGVTIVNFTEQAEPNAINKFDVVAESIWNEPIENVYAEVHVFNSTQDVATFKTPFQTINPWSQATLDGFFDTNGVAPGEYNINVTVYFSNLFTSQSGKIIVNRPLLSMKFSSTTILLLVLIFLVLIMIIMIYIMTTRKNDKKTKI